MQIAQVKTIIAHDSCPDGIVSALIVRDVFPEAQIKFVQYDTKEHESLEATESTIFVDFSPPRHRVREFIEAGAIVLDHHITAKETVEAFGPNGVYAKDPGISGAVLAFNEVWLPNNNQNNSAWEAKLHDIAILTGIRDTWCKSHPRFVEAGYQSSSIMFMPTEFYKTASAKEVFGSFWPKLEWAGKIATMKHQEHTERVVEKGLRFVSKKGTRTLVLEGVSHSTGASEVATDIDLVFAFSFIVEEEPKMIVSTRSRSNFDCAAFAKFNGGGGHLRAAGFSIRNPQKSPYIEARDLVETFETALKMAQ